jgi:hypothetical protein
MARSSSPGIGFTSGAIAEAKGPYSN